MEILLEQKMFVKSSLDWSQIIYMIYPRIMFLLVEGINVLLIYEQEKIN